MKIGQVLRIFRISYKNRWIMLLEISYKKTLDRVVGLFRVGDFL